MQAISRILGPLAAAAMLALAAPAQAAPSSDFSSSLEPGDPQPAWTNTAERASGVSGPRRSGIPGNAFAVYGDAARKACNADDDGTTDGDWIISLDDLAESRQLPVGRPRRDPVEDRSVVGPVRMILLEERGDQRDDLVVAVASCSSERKARARRRNVRPVISAITTPRANAVQPARLIASVSRAPSARPTRNPP